MYKCTVYQTKNSYYYYYVSPIKAATNGNRPFQPVCKITHFRSCDLKWFSFFSHSAIMWSEMVNLHASWKSLLPIRKSPALLKWLNGAVNTVAIHYSHALNPFCRICWIFNRVSNKTIRQNQNQNLTQVQYESISKEKQSKTEQNKARSNYIVLNNYRM